jgi:hypothetical protein
MVHPYEPISVQLGTRFDFFPYGRRAVALIQRGARANENGPFNPYLLVGAAGIVAAAALGVLVNRLTWLVAGAAIGEAAFVCLFWMWGLFDPIVQTPPPLPTETWSPDADPNDDPNHPLWKTLPPLEKEEGSLLEL